MVGVLVIVILTVLLSHGYNTMWRDSLNVSNVAVGDTITFGTFEQDGNTWNGKEDIEWIVTHIHQYNGIQRLTLISKYALKRADIDTYTRTAVQEEWVRSEFQYEAFSDREQEYISSCELPSKEFVERYFDDDLYVCEATPYAKEEFLEGKDAKYVAWYLSDEQVQTEQNISITQSNVVLADGSIYYHGDIVEIAGLTGTMNFYIRPMMTITVK